MAEPIKKPIFSARVASEFGDLTEAEAAGGIPPGFEGDSTYTPGFSEMRQERDLQVLEVAQGVRQGKDVRRMPVNVRLVRCQTPVAARPDGTKILKSGQKGYVAVTEADIGKEWFTKLPPGSEKMPDGTIRKGDTIYMVADAKTAARNQLAKQRATADMVNSIDTSSDGLLGVVGQHKGASPSAKVIQGGDRLSKEQVFAD